MNVLIHRWQEDDSDSSLDNLLDVDDDEPDADDEWHGTQAFLIVT